MNPLPALTPSKPGIVAVVKDQACLAVTTEGARHFGDDLRTVILTGSMARGEATVRTEGSSMQVLGDAEFVLVFRKLPKKTALRAFIADAERMCALDQVTCKIDCSAVLPDYFSQLRPTIYSYELLTCGEVIGGDGSVFTAAPRFSVNPIPLEDAWRMLCNRLIELLEVLPEDSASVPGADTDYRAMKLNLDLATSILLFAGLYRPGYAERGRLFQENQTRLAKMTKINTEQLAQEVDRSTNAKLGRAAIPRFEHSQLRALIATALSVCSWELQQLMGNPAGDSLPAELMRSWMTRQSLGAKLRGWAYVAREQGWFRSWRQWPRWARMGASASPRYWIYLAALQSAQAFASSDTENQALEDFLPLTNGKGGSQADARRQIARNYRECALGTIA